MNTRITVFATISQVTKSLGLWNKHHTHKLIIWEPGYAAAKAKLVYKAVGTKQDMLDKMVAWEQKNANKYNIKLAYIEGKEILRIRSLTESKDKMKLEITKNGFYKARMINLDNEHEVFSLGWTPKFLFRGQLRKLIDGCLTDYELRYLTVTLNGEPAKLNKI